MTTNLEQDTLLIKIKNKVVKKAIINDNTYTRKIKKEMYPLSFRLWEIALGTGTGELKYERKGNIETLS